MTIYLDRTTRDEVIARQIEDDAQIALWLLSRSLIEPPKSPYEKPPHIGARGQYVVATAVDGVWQYEVLTVAEFAERYEEVEDGGDG